MEDIIAAEIMIKSCPVMVCDKGIPLDIAAMTLQFGKKLGVKTLFNPSPKVNCLPQAVYLNTDVIIINRDEGESLTGISATSTQEMKTVISKIHQRGTPQVVLTLGSEGAICSEVANDTSEYSAILIVYM